MLESGLPLSSVEEDARASRNIFMLGLSNDRFLFVLERIYFTAVILAAFFTALSVVASLFQYQLNQRINARKDSEAKSLQEDNARKISDSNSVAAAAGKDAANANLAARQSEQKAAGLEKQAADARLETQRLAESTARLQAEAETARLETQRIRQQLVWRALDQKTAERFFAFCNQNLKSVEIKFSYQSDQETQTFAGPIYNVMLAAGVRVVIGAAYMDMPFEDSKVKGPASNPNRRLVIESLQIIGLKPIVEDAAVLEIVIGLKPPPKL